MAPVSTNLGTPDGHETTAIPAESRTNGPRAKKLPRASTKQDIPTAPDEPGRCLFDKLPLELLAEILLFTESPKDVLAVARCSKFFCATLLNPSARFIWKAARIAYPIPPPEPLSTFTEASYAAFLFDGGTCEVCGKTTDAMYTSFGIRLRLCRNHQCVVRFATGGELRTSNTVLMHDLKIRRCLPYAESHRCFLPHRVGYNSDLYRTKDWLHELHDCAVNPEEYLTRNKSKISYVAAYMKFSKSLFEWKEIRQAAYKSIEDANKKFAEKLAEKYGYNYWDMMNSTPYGELHRHKNRRIENVTQKDYDGVASEVDAALSRLAETRKRKARESAYMENREGVAQHYQRLRSQQPPVILPSLPVFRRLPIVAMLQGSGPSTVEQPSNVSATLKNEKWVIKRLDLELKQWRERARKDLGAVLGYPDWSTASTKVLHPVDRITARFLCKVCSKVALRYRDDECLDFAGACAHQCRGRKKDRREDEVWKAERFVKDEKAIAVLSKLLHLCGADAQFADAATKLAALEDTILCTSCEHGLLVNPKSIIGHSHRHENMEIKLVSDIEGELYFQYPRVRGLVRSLNGLERHVKAMREWVNYGCRHCLNELRLRERKAGAALDEADQLSADVAYWASEGYERRRRWNEKVQKMKFSFNGLSSHLKAKHGVDEPRDEDIFVFRPLEDFKIDRSNGRKRGPDEVDSSSTSVKKARTSDTELV
ncbi:hypothetical protein LshimejAT787_1103810 [Lyophyllum shimeji]|uniref:F-box domain-containing protein n=1 Tax=Lyophyllum shimeji TaxID=47721 RepID=A0A9P3PVD9_LYOSH|nr:hypothetical protein LshimejAT787_1103810 [Lyophyllum shimeji]